MLFAGDRDQAVLIYDGDCAFCNRSLQFGLRNLRWFPAYMPFQQLTDDAYGHHRSDFEASIWLIGESAEFAGHKAAAWILLQQRNIAHRTLGALIYLAGPLSALAYRLIAANRHRLPGGTPACEIEPSSGGKR
jgi:predicted DCC family thiol-disulfide oxidoreductase YuxK